MSRAIKFRAWIKSENSYMGKWLSTQHPTIFSAVNEVGEFYGDDDLVVEQYTGLKDKNGKEIYEGDIVKGEMGIFEAKWYDEIARFCFLPNMHMKWHPNCNQGTTDYMEIVGNIHENPELLEDK